MSRTKNRPIPAGRISAPNALLFGFGLLAWSTFILDVFVNPLSALLAWVGAFYYIVLYTIFLKRNTAYNIIFGGGAGAVPVLVGWAAAAGHLAPAAFLLFAIIFFWTPPHSWALSVLIAADYERGNVPMAPVALSPEITRWQIVWYALLLILLSLLPVPLGILSLVYFAVAMVLGIVFLVRALQLLTFATKKAARQLYKYSSAYLALLFLAMIVDHLLVR